MDIKHWEAVCCLAKEEGWHGEIPRIQWDLRNAVSSLIAQQAQPWDHPQAIPTLLEKNPGVTKIFAQYNDLDIAYALRLARYAEAR